MESICPDETLRMMSLNLCILLMFEATFSLGAGHISPPITQGGKASKPWQIAIMSQTTEKQSDQFPLSPSRRSQCESGSTKHINKTMNGTKPEKKHYNEQLQDHAKNKERQNRCLKIVSGRNYRGWVGPGGGMGECVCMCVCVCGGALKTHTTSSITRIIGMTSLVKTNTMVCYFFISHEKCRIAPDKALLVLIFFVFLHENICLLCFQRQPFITLFHFTAASVKWHVVAVDRLPVLHHSAVCIFYFLLDQWAHFDIFENGVLLISTLEGVNSVANFITINKGYQ